MAHIDLDIADMKPSALVRFEIAQQASQAKQLLVAAVIASRDDRGPRRNVPDRVFPEGMVPGAGIEPATRGFSIRCSTN